jgi:hypothetical protein
MMRPTMIEGPTGESHQCNSLLPFFFFYFFLISLFSITREISLFSCESYVFIGKNFTKELFCQLVLGL